MFENVHLEMYDGGFAALLIHLLNDWLYLINTFECESIFGDFRKTKIKSWNHPVVRSIKTVFPSIFAANFQFPPQIRLHIYCYRAAIPVFTSASVYVGPVVSNSTSHLIWFQTFKQLKRTSHSEFIPLFSIIMLFRGRQTRSGSFCLPIYLVYGT